MKQLSLKHDYISIYHEGKPSYGGSQMWFDKTERASRGGLINENGCGAIAVADLFLYLATTNQKYQTRVTDLVTMGINGYDSSAYIDYVIYINSIYVPLIPKGGSNGLILANAVRRYCVKYSIPLHIGWKAMMNDNRMLTAIKHMLREDLPVILAVGPNMPAFFKRDGIPFYVKEEIPGHRPHFVRSANDNVCAHYVTVTGIVIPDKSRTLLKIASWGKEYYIDYAEYREYVKTKGDRLTSSLLYLTYE